MKGGQGCNGVMQGEGSKGRKGQGAGEQGKSEESKAGARGSEG